VLARGYLSSPVPRPLWAVARLSGSTFAAIDC
jgi:hypothetical protein